MRLAGADGITTQATGASYTVAVADPDEGRNLDQSSSTPELTMQPGEQREVDFSVHVPPNTKPGYYLAGIGVWVPLSAGPVGHLAERKSRQVSRSRCKVSASSVS